MEIDIDIDIKHFYENTEEPIHEIASLLCVSIKSINKYIKYHYSEEYQTERSRKCYRNSKLGNNNPMKGNFLEKHPRYIGEVSDHKGYLIQVKPAWYTGRNKSHHVFVHHVVLCQALDITEIPRGFCVHHIDGDKMNNSLNNLSLQTLGAHQRLHRMQNNPPDADALFESRYD
jgi:HNH endonuclease